MGLFMKTDNVFFKSKGSYSYVVTVDMDNQMYMVRKYVKTYVKSCDKDQVKGKKTVKKLVLDTNLTLPELLDLDNGILADLFTRGNNNAN